MGFIQRLPLYGEEAKSSPQEDITYFNRDSIDNPHEGDWRLLKKDGRKHSELQRFQLGEWLYHGDFGGSFLAGDHILDSKVNMLYYPDEDGNKIVFLRASHIDGGTYLGCTTKGISLVHNGRLEAWRSSTVDFNTPLYNNGTDTQSVSSVVYTTNLEDFYQTMVSFSFFVSAVESGTKMRVKVVEGATCWYENTSQFDFSLGFGDDVVVGENVFTFNPCISIASGDQYEIVVEFSAPVEVVGTNVPPFSSKYSYIYKILTPSSIPQVHVRESTTGVYVDTYLPLSTTLFSAAHTVCEADEIHRVFFSCDMVGSNPAVAGVVQFLVGGAVAAEIPISVGNTTEQFCCSVPTTCTGFEVRCSVLSPPGESYTLDNVYFILEEL